MSFARKTRHPVRLMARTCQDFQQDFGTGCFCLQTMPFYCLLSFMKVTAT